MELRKQIETLYTKGAFHDARQLLLKNKQALGEELFHYNYGVLHAKEKQWGPARYHFEVLAKKGYGHGELNYNLDVVKTSVQEKSFLSSFQDHSIAFLLDTPTIVFGCTFLMVFVLFLLIAFIKRLRNRWTTGVAFVLVVVIACAFIFKAQQTTAIVLKKSVAREGPSTIFDQLHSLPEGTRLTLKRYSEGWWLINHPSTLRGWVHKDEIGIY